MTDQPYTDAELEAGARALPVAHGCEDPDWLAVARADAAAVLGAVLPAHAARIRRETPQRIAAAIEEADRHVDVTAAEMAATARAHATTPTEGDQDD